MKSGKVLKLLLLPLIIGGTFPSCKKGELPVTPPTKGDVTTASVEMSSNYKYQIYFDLSSNSNKGMNVKTDWDLGISCSSENPAIILNTSKVMFAAPITALSFDEISDTTGFSTLKQVDASNGRIEETALFGHTTFIVEKGMNELGQHLGFFKLEIIENTDVQFKGRFANLDGSSEETVTLQKDSDFNFIFVNWSNGVETKAIEPPKTEWDLIFTQYTFIFHEPEYYPYLVTGCLTNHTNTWCYEESNKSFDAIDLAYAESLVLSSDRDIIGYDWKVFDGNTYTIDSERTFIIRDQDGYYYKLRFIDFYNDQGEKGSPRFEYQRL